MLIATLVAPDGLKAGDISRAADAVKGRPASIVDGVACDIAFDGDPIAARALLEAIDGVDVVIQRVQHRRRTLLVADMDSTMITVECIDELADYAGIKAEVAAVTERAMRGDIDFATALRDRVALLAGMPEATVAECLRARVKIMPGAKALVRTVRAHGGHALLVSGGFTHFAAPLAADIGFDRAIANRLVVSGGRLTGAVEPPIVDAAAKKAALCDAHRSHHVPVEASIAIGDGANDIPMIMAAGLGIAYRAKARTEAAADARVRFGDLSVLLYALGYDRAMWADG